MKEVNDSNRDILYALCLMWMQYCPSPLTHQFMSAGEETEAVLDEYGLLGGDSYPNFEKLGVPGIEYLYRKPMQ